MTAFEYLSERLVLEAVAIGDVAAVWREELANVIRHRAKTFDEDFKLTLKKIGQEHGLILRQHQIR